MEYFGIGIGIINALSTRLSTLRQLTEKLFGARQKTEKMQMQNALWL